MCQSVHIIIIVDVILALRNLYTAKSSIGKLKLAKKWPLPTQVSPGTCKIHFLVKGFVCSPPYKSTRMKGKKQDSVIDQVSTH